MTAPRTHILRVTRADGTIYAVGPMHLSAAEYQAAHWRQGETVEVLPKPVLADAPKPSRAEVEAAAAATCTHCHHVGLKVGGLLYGEEAEKWRRYESAAMRKVVECGCGWNEVSGAPGKEWRAERRGTTYGT